MKNSVLWQNLVSVAGRRAATVSLALAMVLASIVVATSSAQAQTYKESVLQSFTGADGGYPEAGLIFDAKGNLYGTTEGGGSLGYGTVYKVNSKDKETVLYNFTGGADGGYPVAGLIFDAKGNLYGTAWGGGASGDGVVFKVNSKGQETVLHSFTGADGAGPYAGLIFDAKGNLYGATAGGGASGDGVVFKVNSKGQETVLHSFTGGVDGAYPQEALIFDAQGNLYGTAAGGGASGDGVVFKVNSKGQETVLHSFTGGADGAYPFASLIFDAKGNLYGTTSAGGGTGCVNNAGCGTVFEVSKTRKETVLYRFTGGADGRYPEASLIFDPKGNLYSTTYSGGASGAGTVFEVSSKGKETVLHSFTGGADGGGPVYAGLIFDPKGNLYDTTSAGGASGAGTVFKLHP